MHLSKGPYIKYWHQERHTFGHESAQVIQTPSPSDHPQAKRMLFKSKQKKIHLGSECMYICQRMTYTQIMQKRRRVKPAVFSPVEKQSSTNTTIC